MIQHPKNENVFVGVRSTVMFGIRLNISMLYVCEQSSISIGTPGNVCLFFRKLNSHSRSESYLPVLKSLSVIRSFVLSVVIFRKLSTAAYDAELIK